MTFFKLIHLFAVLIWVGGMFFAYAILRPAVAGTLQPPERLRLWNSVFRRFFNWVWGSAGLILVTGLYMIYQQGGMGHVAHYVHIMLLLGLLMVFIYAYVFFGCYVPFSLHVAKARWKDAGLILSKIRYLIAVNLALGLVTIAVAKIGLLWG